jgi:hypothetical protein
MTSALRKLAQEPNGALAAQAFIAAQNFIKTGLATEDEIRARLILKSTIAKADAFAAIDRGLAAARKPA